jgi:DNA helicase-2/ATP-dependent DNA helicase PcrA
MSTGSDAQIEEERRLLYVAMTRARDELHLIHPLRFYVRQQNRRGDRHLFAPLSRFLPDSVHEHFERVGVAKQHERDRPLASSKTVDVAARLRNMW